MTDRPTIRVRRAGPRFAGALLPIVLLAVGLPAGGAGAAEAPTSCEVTRLVGPATLQREGTTAPLSPNVLLYERDSIRRLRPSHPRFLMRCCPG